MADPQQAWQKASTIGPVRPQKAPPGEMMRGEMPMPELGSILAGLKGLGGLGARALGFGGEAPDALQGLSRAIPGIAAKPYNAAREYLGEILPEFTPRGGEEMYNIGRAGAGAKMEDPIAAEAFRKYTAKPPQTPFRQLQDAGAFRGDRTTGQFPEQPGGLSDALQALVRMR